MDDKESILLQLAELLGVKLRADAETLNLLREARDALALHLDMPDTESVGKAPVLFVEMVKARLDEYLKRKEP